MAFVVIPCASCGESGGGGTPATIDATVQRLAGAGSIVVAAGARSVTLTVISGDVTADLGQGITSVPAGNALTWSVDADGETLTDAFTFTGVAGSDFIVQTTRAN